MQPAAVRPDVVAARSEPLDSARSNAVSSTSIGMPEIPESPNDSEVATCRAFGRALLPVDEPGGSTPEEQRRQNTALAAFLREIGTWIERLHGCGCAIIWMAKCLTAGDQLSRLSWRKDGTREGISPKAARWRVRSGRNCANDAR